MMAAWSGIARLLMVATFAQAFFAGVFLSGELWGRDLHRFMGFTIAGISVVLAVIAVVSLREESEGRRFALSLVGFAVMVAIQLALGLAYAEGTRTLWLHLPLGVGLVGAAAGLETTARQLGQPDAPTGEVP